MTTWKNKVARTKLGVYIIYIHKFYMLKTEKIYSAHIGVDPGMLDMGDASDQHPNHSSRAITSHTASVKWNKIFPYATSIISRPYEPVVLRNITTKQNPCPKVWSCKHMYIYIKYSQQMASSLNLSNYKSCT